MIEEKLLKLKIDKTPGPNDIHPRILKEIANQLAVPLSILFQDSYDQDVLPNDWKFTYVSAIYKKRCKNELSPSQFNLHFM